MLEDKQSESVATNSQSSSTGTGIDVDKYISTINDLKKNSVSSEEFLKLKEENRKLLNSIVSGESVKSESSPKADTVESLRERYVNADNMTNLEYIQTALSLREELLSRGENDPFTPYGKSIVATTEDKQMANDVAEFLQGLVDVADGDPDIFQNELQRRLVDTFKGKRR